MCIVRARRPTGKKVKAKKADADGTEHTEVIAGKHDMAPELLALVTIRNEKFGGAEPDALFALGTK